jgi:hypothetical protein
MMKLKIMGAKSRNQQGEIEMHVSTRKNWTARILALGVVLLSALFSRNAEAVVTIYPTPSDASVSTARFGVKINNVSTAVYDFFDQKNYNYATTAEPHFAAFTTDQNVSVAVTTTFDFSSYIIRPLSKSISATRSGRTLTFTMPTSARQLSIEFNGDARKPLLLFSNPPDPGAPTASATNYTDYNKKIFYYAPGVSTVDFSWLYGPDYDGWTFYLAGGAIIKGDIGASPNNLTIRGPGVWAVLSGSGTPLNVRGNNFTLKDTIVVNRRDEWTVQVTGCNDANFENFKLLSEIRDGFDVVNAQRVTLKNSFVMAHDDAICIKGQWYGNNEDVDTVNVENSVIANMGGGNCIEFGYEASTPNMKNITFKNLDLIHSLPNVSSADSAWPEGAITMHLDGPARISNVTYDDIRIENNQDDYLIDFSYKGSGTSDIDGVTVKNVRVVAGDWKPSRIAGKSSTAMVKNVSFINLKKPDGTVITSDSQGNFSIGSFTSNITFSSANTNLASNASFDAENYNTQTPSGWSEWSGWPVGTHYDAGYTESHGGAYSGARHGTHWKSSAYNIYTYQIKTGLANGLYTVRCRAKRGGGQTTCRLEAKDYGGSLRAVTLPVSSSYQLVEIKDINVTNGQCTFGIWSNANANNWAYFDDFEFFRQ